jgi:hypothetical protein
MDLKPQLLIIPVSFFSIICLRQIDTLIFLNLLLGKNVISNDLKEKLKQTYMK